VGLLPEASFESGRIQLTPGTRLVVVTDCVTEAENPEDDMFGSERLQALFPHSESLDDIFHAVTEFCSGKAFNDDCTVLQLSYRLGVAEDMNATATGSARR